MLPLDSVRSGQYESCEVFAALAIQYLGRGDPLLGAPSAPLPAPLRLSRPPKKSDSLARLPASPSPQRAGPRLVRTACVRAHQDSGGGSSAAASASTFVRLVGLSSTDSESPSRVTAKRPLSVTYLPREAKGEGQVVVAAGWRGCGGGEGGGEVPGV